MMIQKLYLASLLSLGLFMGSTFLLASSMTVIDESTEVDSVVNSIELPPPIEDSVRQTLDASRNQAKQAREEGREKGRQQLDSARQANQELQDRERPQEPPPQRP